MKIAAAHALAELAREDVPDEVAAAYGTRPKYGPDYIIPVPFDPRLISCDPARGRQGRDGTGVARKPIADMDAYRQQLRSRRDPVASVLQRVYERLRRRPQRVVFAEGEEEQVIRAAASFVQQGLGTALLVGREDRVRASAAELGVELGGGIEIINAALSQRNATYADYLYERLQRKGYLQRDCHRLVNQDRNHFAACMVALGDADAMVTGVTRNFSVALDDVRRVHRSQARPPRDRRLARAGARPHRAGRRYRGHRDAPTPRCWPTSRSRPPASRAGSATSRASRCSRSRPSAIRPASAPRTCRRRCRILDQRRVDFEYDGDMAADVALNMELRAGLSVLPAVGPGQRADHAGVPLGLDLDQAAAGARRRHRDRADPGRARPAGADRAAVGQRQPARQHGGAGGVQRAADELTHGRADRC